MGNTFRLFFAAVMSFAAMILAIVACAGSTKNYNPINKIFCAQVDLTKLSTSTVFPKLGSSSASLTSMGLPAYINLGLWSYCVANSNGKVDSCTSPHGIQEFNLRSILLDNIDNNQVTNLIDTVAEIVLPKSLDTKIGYYNDLVKCMFITLLIGIAVTFVNLCVNIIRWILHFRIITWFGGLLSFIGFVSLLLSAATNLGTYVYIRHVLNSNYSEYGIRMNLGRNYIALTWAAVGGCLINLLLWMTVRTKNIIYAPNSFVEKRPLI